MKPVTVYVPCYNVERTLKDCLEAILRQTYTPDEILVVDDGSTDRTAEIAKGYPVRTIRHPQNKGLAAARNTAVLNSRNELVASVDADVAPSAEWLERIVVNMEHDGFAGGGGRLVEKFQQTLADKWRATHMVQNRRALPSQDVPTISGSNALLKASAIKRAGLYNEQFRRSFEDHDICYRLRRLGYRLYFRPDAVCYHLRRDSIRSVVKTWCQWRAPAWHQKPATLENLLIKMKEDVRDSLLDIAETDLRNLQLRFSAIDIFLASYSIYSDLRYYFYDRRRVRSRGERWLRPQA
jgi:glycosyltransferase involved in cell wall biosynthesis